MPKTALIVEDEIFVALDLERTGDQLTVTVPSEVGIAPDGWYMLFVTTAAGIPSQAKWVHVSGSD